MSDPSSEEMKQKAQIRQSMRRKIAEFTPEFKERASQAICRHLAELISPFPEKKVAIFAAMPNEPQLAELHTLLPKTQFHYPFCGANRKMTFHQVPHPSELILGRHGILAPDLARHPLVNPAQLDVIFCPGLAFTIHGHRLGQGGGYYDRYLVKTPQAQIFGVAFQTQIIPEIPCLAHDYSMQKIITELGLI